MNERRQSRKMSLADSRECVPALAVYLKELLISSGCNVIHCSAVAAIVRLLPRSRELMTPTKARLIDSPLIGLLLETVNIP